MEEKKSFKVSLGTVVCMFMILILIMALVVVYYLGFVKNNQKISDLKNEINSLNSKNNITQSEKTEMKSDDVNNDEESSEIESNDISVVDALNYSDGYYQLFKVKLPRIVGNTDTIEKLNLKILNEVLPSTYADVACHAITEDTENVSMDKGSIYNYTYAIKNNILIIYVYSTVPEGGSTIPATGGGLIRHTYYYDINYDEILTIGDVASKLKLSLDGLTTIEGDSITSYNELERNGYIITINNNELKLESML